MNELYLPEGAYIGTRANDEAMASLENLIRAKALGTVLEARVQLCDGAHDLSVALGKYKGIIPRAEAVFCPNGEEPRDIAVITRVGKTVCFVVTDVILHDGEEPRILLSRRRAQELLSKTSLSLGEVADIVGISNVWYFKKLFEKETGATVDGWRAQTAGAGRA